LQHRLQACVAATILVRAESLGLIEQPGTGGFHAIIKHIIVRPMPIGRLAQFGVRYPAGLTASNMVANNAGSGAKNRLSTGL